MFFKTGLWISHELCVFLLLFGVSYYLEFLISNSFAQITFTFRSSICLVFIHDKIQHQNINANSELFLRVCQSYRLNATFAVICRPAEMMVYACRNAQPQIILTINLLSNMFCCCCVCLNLMLQLRKTQKIGIEIHYNSNRICVMPFVSIFRLWFKALATEVKHRCLRQCFYARHLKRNVNGFVLQGTGCW